MPSAAKSLTRQQLRSIARQRLRFLADEGYRPRCDDDEEDENVRTIQFKSEGELFLLFVYEDDPDYFNVGLCFDLGEGPHDPAALTALTVEVNDHVKGVKCSICRDDNSVRFQVETFLGGAKPNGTVLARSLGALRHAASFFYEKRVPPAHLDA
jgi:hypothetical protein